MPRLLVACWAMPSSVDMKADLRTLVTCAMRSYEHESGWNRPELEGDIQRVVRVFCGEFLPKEARYRHVSLGDSPTSQELLDGLRELATSGDRTNDEYLVVYLTGHGEILEDGEHVLLTADSRPSDLMHRTVRTSDVLRTLLAKTKVQRLLLILDTCYAGRGAADLAKEALRRLDGGDGKGVVIVSATRSREEALPGQFTTLLAESVRSLAAAGSAPPTLRIGALVTSMNTSRNRAESQTVVWHALGLETDEPAFLRNPRFRRELVESDLLEQERVTYSKHRDMDLLHYFSPRILWFTGRDQSLTSISSWLAGREPEAHLVVTGHAGSGKSAVLGLLASMSDVERAPTVPKHGLPAEFDVPPGIIKEAIYAGGLTTEAIRDRMAAALGIRANSTAEFLEACQEMPTEVTILIDAIDEAAEPEQLARSFLGPLMRYGSGRLRLMLGARPHLFTDRLLGAPPNSGYRFIDLDSATYADPASMRLYVQRILLEKDSLDSSYAPSGIYRRLERDVLQRIVNAISTAAENSFLVARIVATTQATSVAVPDPTDAAWLTALPSRAGDAMAKDLDFRLREQAERAMKLLLPLAYARGNGLPWEKIWPQLANALFPGSKFGDEDLIWLRRSAGSYVVESTLGGHSVYRLYHQALADYLLELRDPIKDTLQICDVLLDAVLPLPQGRRDWAASHPYIRQYLASHAKDANRIDSLVTDPEYLMWASPPELHAALQDVESTEASRNADAYRRAFPRLKGAGLRQRTTALQIAANCGYAPRLATALQELSGGDDWCATWSHWRPEAPHQKLFGESGEVESVAVSHGGSRTLVAAGTQDGWLRLWDAATGSEVDAQQLGKSAFPLAVAFSLKTTTLASGGADGVIRIWDAKEGLRLDRGIDGHSDWVRCVAFADMAGKEFIVSGSDDLTIRLWNLEDGSEVSEPLRGNTDWIRSIAVSARNGEMLIASGGDDNIVRVWRSNDGLQFGTPISLVGHSDVVRAVSFVRVGSREVLVSGGEDGSIIRWDVQSGRIIGAPFRQHRSVIFCLTAGEIQGRTVIASGGRDATIRLWDAESGASLSAPLTGHESFIRSIALASVGSRSVIVSGGAEGTVRIWDPSFSDAFDDDRGIGHSGSILGLAGVSVGDQPILVSGSKDGTARVWAAASGEPLGPPIAGHGDWVSSVAVAVVNNRLVVASSSQDGDLFLSDVETGLRLGELAKLESTDGSITALTNGRISGADVIVSGTWRGTLTVSDAVTGLVKWRRRGCHEGRISAVRVTSVGQRDYVFSAGHDGVIRRWIIEGDNFVESASMEHGSRVHCLAVDVVGETALVVSGGEDAVARLWNGLTGQPVGEPCVGHSKRILSLTIGHLGGRSVVISGSEDENIRLWNAHTGEKILPEDFLPHRELSRGGDFDRDVEHLALLSPEERERRLADREREALPRHSGGVWSLLVVNRFGRTVVVSGGGDGTLRSWSLATQRAIGDPIRAHKTVIRGLAAEGEMIFSYSQDGEVLVWRDGTRRIGGYKLAGGVAGFRSGAFAVAIVADRSVLVTAEGYEVERTRVANVGGDINFEQLRDAFLRMKGRGAVLGRLGERTVLASGADHGAINLWDVETGAYMGQRTTRLHSAVSALTLFTLDGQQMIAVGGVGGEIALVALGRGSLLGRCNARRLVTLGSEIRSLRAWPEGLAVVCSDGRLWRFHPRRLRNRVEPWESFGAPASSLVFLRGGRGVVVSSDRDVMCYAHWGDAKPVERVSLDAEVNDLLLMGESLLVATRLGIVSLRLPVSLSLVT